ncbi:4'-phosphopantetheinyl transferase family protein [Streptomyces anulatus]|uniref:4'-phosphopantetheinyl transferase family protein n=1 Tax=Streptomyces anulatus TaxID=1892 RepID=UPI0004CB3EBB|nr:4'-phosphopantetheinyl transferase superfamily protein [Streptomyces anulatus]
MIAEVVPAGVRAREAFDDDGPDSAITLFATEQAVVDGVLDERRREFTTVRGCARAALTVLGVAPAPLVPGPLGAPGWPAGVVGSMTHCRNYRAAAVALTEDFAALGIDAEPREPLPRFMAERIVTDVEARWLRQDFPSAVALPLDRLLFCAKEASYKAFSPWTGTRFGFRDFTVRLRPDGTFHIIPPTPEKPISSPDPAGLTGRWTACSSLLLSVVALSASCAPNDHLDGLTPKAGKNWDNWKQSTR